MSRSIYELGAEDWDEIVGQEVENTIRERVKAMTTINDSLYKALSSYKEQVTLGRWTSPIGAIVYSADDIGHATWEVENWHTAALKWMTDGADALRKESISGKDWSDWGIRLSNSAKEIATKLADVGLVKRTKQFATTFPEAFRKTVEGAASGAGALAKPFLGSIPWYVWAIGGTIAAVALINAVGGAARNIRGEP